MLSLHHHSCLSVVVCHAICRGAALVYKNVNAGMVNQGILFESYLKIKEIIIPTASVFGRIGVGLRTKEGILPPILPQILPGFLPWKLLRLWDLVLERCEA